MTHGVTRAGAMSGLAAAIVVTAASAQVVVESSPTPVKGSAPVVAVSIANASRPGKAPITGDVVTATATVTDAEGDSIDSITYRWLRNDTDVGSEEAYATTTADTGQELRVEVIARTDDESTDPAQGVGLATVSITNAPPVASNLRIEGTRFVGETLTAKYDYDDVEGDEQGGSIVTWCRRGDRCGIGSGLTYRVTEEDRNEEIQFEVTPIAVTGTLQGEKVGVANGTALIPSGQILLGATTGFHTLPANFAHEEPGNTGNASANSKITYLIGMEDGDPMTMLNRNVKVEVIAPNGTVVWTTTCMALNGFSRSSPSDPLWRYSDCNDRTVQVNLSEYPRAGIWRLVVTALSGSAPRIHASVTVDTG